MIKLSISFLTIILLATSSLQAQTLDGVFNYGGYMRSGFGVDGQGKPMDYFKAPNAEAKYRFGNETEMYMETLFQYLQEDENGVKFETNACLAFVTPTSKSNSFETTLSVREAYVKMSGFLPRQKEMSFWAGQRFYDRYSNYMIDFWYRDMSGFGGGFENLKLGNAMNFSFAFLGGSIDNLQSNGNVYPENRFALQKTTFDFSLNDIKLPGGVLKYTFDLSNFTGDSIITNEGNIHLKDNIGWSMGIIYESNLNDKGVNFFHVFYGQGAAENYRAVMTLPVGWTIYPDVIIDPAKMKRFRILDDISYNVNEHFSFIALTEYQYLVNGMEQNNILNWFSAGVQPVYHFSRYFSLTSEFAMDYTSQKGMKNGVVGKFTIAPQLQPLNKFLSRPVLRAFFTYSKWSDDYIGMVAPISFPEKNHGISFGLQLETWW